jgi:UDP-hydrolysing UDP-N-acetyl-D-glucosamine 2-epimerase
MGDSRRIAVVTTGRQDYGILRSLILALEADDDFELDLWVGGMHLSERFGATAELIRSDGVARFRALPILSDPPDPPSDAARAVDEATRLIRARRPEALVVLGDRSESAAVALAATVLGVPLVHLHGGEESEGAIDNALRHAITKMSHLHFTTHRVHRDRVLQMGEPASAVHLVPPPGLDNRVRADLPDRRELLGELGLDPASDRPVVIVTIHPTTLRAGGLLDETEAVAGALEGERHLVVVTLPNADAGGERLADFWARWAAGRPHVCVVASLGERRYWGLMKAADAMVSNSSSGLIEAPAVHLPVVNVGDRQKGRLRHPMTLDVAPEAPAIARALETALDPDFRARLRASPPLFPEGAAAPRIVEVLRRWSPPAPARKRFVRRGAS